jgi:hypothetical protein
MKSNFRLARIPGTALEKILTNSKQLSAVPIWKLKFLEFNRASRLLLRRTIRTGNGG